ncbi:uncharacterized protein LOC105232377 isoform X1 [Bactrocera dorsalis]|uniref:Uncharacterized protein LOC105232377 isoform X1 n=1 Tax=Bactrocera dorsalis TaxID=27457 RepID=A0ABM3K5H5_BACDO|nr:uncharacterized protein LOC105232377 isoform X1 [Bactrocera dorsalis]
MVEFWGIFVVFSACAAIQLTESRIQHAYRPTSLSDSDELSDISNSISDSSKDDSSTFIQTNLYEDTSVTSTRATQETQANIVPHVQHSRVNESTESNVEITTPSATTSTPKIRFSLSERREALHVLTYYLLLEYSKDYVSKTRNVMKKLIHELESLTEKSDDVKKRLTELKATLKELEGFDIEPDNLEEASEIVTKLNHELDEPVNEPLEVVAALRKVGWMDMRYELGDEMSAITDKFVIAFNQFVDTLTPWERLTEADLVDLNKRFNDDTTVDRWDLFPDFWKYLTESYN